MSRYFISTANGHEVEDEEGVELSGREELRTILRRTLTAILHDESANDGATECSARACDEDGRLVMQARASIDITDP
ncbi:hypothetical protein SAMN02799625_05920 [Methylobacterium sp. UNC300MFChir4.1]|uniref:DUF6894 family protein n=1 Tax=unclassified Methylobacterium TaxID=2615210 RepID=UPI0008B1B559|nr:hypothetical protein [Methylobacterium sp. UNC300MFChir4.1]SEP39642.1 hypothetical protein SAMN02799625_05920 [Methylobacterium sp. UNC300MFChir4.1]